MDIRSMSLADVDYVAAVHEYAFPDFFLTLLGHDFLKRYYLTVLEYEDSISLVHLNSHGSIDGFAVGFGEPSAFYSFLKKKGLPFIWPVLKGFFRRPRLLKRILMNVLRVNASDSKEVYELSCELSSIGVKTQGRGIGKRLLSEFVEVACSKGLRHVLLTTDVVGNRSVIDFYLTYGFIETHIETRGDRKMSHLSLIIHN